MKKLLGFFLMMSLLGAGISTAHAQYRQQVTNQLNAVALIVGSAGFQKTHDYYIDDLRDNNSDSYTVTLRQGTSYKLVAVCDNDCNDIDMTLYDENGNEIDKDVQSDDTPILEVRPRWTGQFRIKVTMYGCNTNPCYFGIGVFGN